ncbi:MAG TPA: hypothetical protein VMR25_13675 [Planctomycetaceae bacterium]|jgi:hypothetical protein|nr:hypothetical protein [Planctomycetaceae bacterium]
MVTETLTERTTVCQSSCDLGNLIDFVNRETQQQVQDLSIRHRDGGLIVTGRSRTYYAKQLVTQAIFASLPAVRLVNEICVG